MEIELPRASVEPVEQNRSGFIDALRGVAILLILLYHGDNFFTIQSSALSPAFPPELSQTLFQNGYYGVTIFFVVSGFLITRISLARFGRLPNMRPGLFYLLRLGRIAPCLGLMLLVLLGLHLFQVRDFVCNSSKASISGMLTSALTFRYNLLLSKNGWILLPWDVLWSLSVEEVFYLFFPLFCLVLRGRRPLLFGCLLLIAGGPIARAAGQTDFEKLYGYLGCFDLIALGCATAIIQSIPAIQKGVRRLGSIGAIFGLILAIGVIADAPVTDAIVIGPTVLGIGIALMLLAMTAPGSRSKPSILTWPLRFLGKHCYEVYLFHAIVLLLLVNYLKELDFDLVSSSPALLVFFVCLCGLVGGFIGKAWSKPANRSIRALASVFPEPIFVR